MVPLACGGRSYVDDSWVVIRVFTRFCLFGASLFWSLLLSFGILGALQFDVPLGSSEPDKVVALLLLCLAPSILIYMLFLKLFRLIARKRE